LYSALELFDSISRTLSKLATASSFLPSSLRANPLCNHATILFASVSRTLSKHDIASLKLFFLEKEIPLLIDSFEFFKNLHS